MKIELLETERLILVPFTIEICEKILDEDFGFLNEMKLKKGNGWPDDEVLDTLPKIINKLSEVDSPTGFESWMIIKKDSKEIIGDAGFKGFNIEEFNADLGYGIIEIERRKGYAQEAAKALIKWAFSNKKLKEITARCMADNINSMNLLNKLNFKLVKKDNEMIHWVLGRN